MPTPLTHKLLMAAPALPGAVMLLALLFGGAPALGWVLAVYVLLLPVLLLAAWLLRAVT